MKDTTVSIIIIWSTCIISITLALTLCVVEHKLVIMPTIAALINLIPTGWVHAKLLDSDDWNP